MEIILSIICKTLIIISVFAFCLILFIITKNWNSFWFLFLLFSAEFIPNYVRSRTVKSDLEEGNDNEV